MGLFKRRRQDPPAEAAGGGSRPGEDALLALAHLLAPGEVAVADRVRLASADPVGYLTLYDDELIDRGIEEPIPSLAWIALVDGLEAADLLTELDWKDAPVEIVHDLRGLRSAPEAPAVWEQIDRHAGEIRTTFEFLQQVGRDVAAGGTALATLDIDSDSYPLVMVAHADAPQVVSLARTAGYRIMILGA